MALTKGKQALVTAKNESGLPFEINKIDIVKLVKDAWRVSFARVETNRKAVLNRGWGPKALNMNVLRHPEILSSKPKEHGCQPTSNKIDVLSTLPASELNISEGLSGTLIDRIVLQSNKDARTSGASIADMMIRRQATARRNLENHEKRCTAGLIASAGMIKLNEEILSFARKSKEVQEAKQHEKLLKAKDAYDTLCQKVDAIRTKNSPPEKWTCSELNTMIQWYKRPDDAAMPSQKNDKLARYHEICGCVDPTPPQLPTELSVGIPLVPPTAQLPELSDVADSVLGQATAADLLELTACADPLVGLAVAADPLELTAGGDLLLAVTNDDDPADKLLTPV
jgi:hypothetical protein